MREVEGYDFRLPPSFIYRLVGTEPVDLSSDTRNSRTLYLDQLRGSPVSNFLHKTVSPCGIKELLVMS